MTDLTAGSRYHFVTYIQDDDPGDVSTGIADRVPLAAAIARLAEGAPVKMTEDAARYRLLYARAALVYAVPASPELAELEMAITKGVWDALVSTPRLPDPLAASKHSMCTVCCRESLLAESVGKRCGAVIWDQLALKRLREQAREDLAAGGLYGATPEIVASWDKHDGRCSGVMTAVVRDASLGGG